MSVESKEQRLIRRTLEMRRIFYLSLIGTAICGFVTMILVIVTMTLFTETNVHNQIELLQLIAYLLAVLVASKFTKNLFMLMVYASRNY